MRPFKNPAILAIGSLTMLLICLSIYAHSSNVFSSDFQNVGKKIYHVDNINDAYIKYQLSDCDTESFLFNEYIKAKTNVKDINSSQSRKEYSQSGASIIMPDCDLDFAEIVFTIEDLTECGQFAQVHFSAFIGDITDISIVVDIPGSFEFKENVSGASTLGSAPLIFSADIIDNAIDITFDIQAVCLPLNTDRITLDFNYVGAGENCTQISLPIPVENINVSIAPVGTPGRNTENILEAVLNKNDTLISTVVQEGLGTAFEAFYSVDLHPLMTLVNVVDCITNVPLPLVYSNGTTNFYTIGTDNFGVDGFVRNEGVDICEIWNVISCPDGPIQPVSHSAFISCSGDPAIDICKESPDVATLDFGAKVPEITHYIDTSIDYDPTCFVDGKIKQSWKLMNVGDAPAGEINVYLTEFGGATPIDITSFNYKIGQNGTSAPFEDDGANTDFESLYNANLSGCVTDPNVYTRMNLIFKDIVLEVGDTLFFDYNIIPEKCSCSGCSMPTRLGVDIADLEIKGLCGSITQNSIITENVAWPNFDVDLSSFMETPVTNCAGSVSTLSQTYSNYNNAYQTNQGYNWQDDPERNEVYFNNGACTDCYLESTFIIPNGLDYIPGTIVWSDDDGTQWIPDLINYTDNDGGPDLLIVRWTGQEPSGFDPFSESSLVAFDFTPDCDNELAKGPGCSPVLYNDKITKSTVWSSGDCDGCGPETIECAEDIDVVIKCPGSETDCMCDGFVQTQGVAERFNLNISDPDNNGIPNEGDAYNEDILRRDRFLKGDSVEVKMGGYVSANGTTFTSYDYIYAEVTFPNLEYIPIGGEVTIIQPDGTTFTCDVLTQTIEAGNVLLTDLSIATLTANGCTVPATYSHLDSIALIFYYESTDPFVGETQQLVHRTRIFASDEPYGGAEYTCRLPIDYRMTQVGTQTSFDYYNSRLNGFEGCDIGTAYYRGFSRIRSQNIDFFPGEYIGNVEFITQFTSTIPAGTNVDFMRIYIRKKNASGTNNFGSQISGFGNYVDIQVSHPAITVLGNQMIFDMETFLIEQTGDADYPYSDEGYSWSLQPYFIATCNLETGPLEDAMMTANHNTSANLFCSSEYSFEDTRTDLRYDGGAEILIYASSDCIIVDQFPECSNIVVENKGGSLSNNTWLSFNSPTGRILFNSLTEITGGISDEIIGNEFNMFQLGDLKAGTIHNYTLCVNANICEIDSIQIASGYDCQNEIESFEEALCFSEDWISFKSERGALGMIAKFPDENIILDDLCDTIDYVIDISASGPGFLTDVYLDINLPLDIEFVPGSFEIAYYTSASPSTIPPDSEFAPATDALLVFGNTFRFDVSGNDPILSTSGLIGSDGSSENKNVVNVRFKAMTTCGFASGSRIFFESNAKEGCGNDLEPIQSDFSSSILISEAPTPFVSEIKLESTVLNACTLETASVNVGYKIKGAMSSGLEDSIRVILPPGITYVPGSYAQGTNPLPDPPVALNSSGLEVLYWGIGGLNPNDEANFEFEIQANDIGQACKEYQLLVQTFKSGMAFCDATDETCIVRSISDEGIANILIEKPSLVIQSGVATSMSMGTDEMVMVSLETENVGDVEMTPGTDVIIDLYTDIDGDGRVTPGLDFILDDITFNFALLPGELIKIIGEATIPSEYSCGFLAVLDPAKNCACEFKTTGRIQTNLDLKIEDNFEVCSNESIDIGPDNPNYTYEWISMGGSDLSALSPSSSGSPVSFSFDNNTGTIIDWEYGLRILRQPGCYSFDTVQIRIFPETTGLLETTVCGPIEDCGDGPIGFPLAGPLNGTMYNWSVTEGDLAAVVDDAMSPNSNVSSVLSGPTTFMLNYLDENECDATFIQKVTPLNCACTALGDTVWFDLNVDGIQDLGEPGIPGVTVYLYDATNTTTPLQSTTTDANGYYIFQPLPAGNYIVGFDESTHTSPYHQLVPTLQNVGNDEDDNDADPLTGLTGSYFLPNGISNLTIDAGFYPAFDLALIKEIDLIASPGPYFPGDNITYNITVYNQGGYYPATNIMLEDYIPTGLNYVSGTNTSVLSNLGETINVTASGGGAFSLDHLSPLDQVTLSITLQIDPSSTATQFINYAEISSFENEYDLDDVDSNPDNISTNDAGGNPETNPDNYVDGDGSGSPLDNDETTDEDDHDPAVVKVQEVDFALIKKLDPSYNAEPIAVGELIKYSIIMVNQGDIASDSMLIKDYPPAGLSFDHTIPENAAIGWQADGSLIVQNQLLPGAKDTACIYLTNSII